MQCYDSSVSIVSALPAAGAVEIRELQFHHDHIIIVNNHRRQHW
jgi:hypothetical protein